jgi:DNA-binding MarR family transcriptional regulator
MEKVVHGGTTAQQRAWRLMLGLFFEERGRMLEVAHEFGLAPQQAFALMSLRPDTPMKLGDLAGKLRCDNSNVTGIADRLEAAGLAQRTAHPTDRRVKTLLLTELGAMVRAQYQERLSHTPAAIEALADDDAAALVEILQRATP